MLHKACNDKVISYLLMLQIVIVDLSQRKLQNTEVAKLLGWFSLRQSKMVTDPDKTGRIANG